MSIEPQFLVLGHSSETFVPYEDRPPVPPGRTLLVFAECDRVTRTADIEKALQLASETPLDFSKFRVYREGEPYPPLNLQLVSDMEAERTKDKSYVPLTRSGVYAGPLNLSEFIAHEEFAGRRWQQNEQTANSIYTGYDKRLRIPNSRKRFETFKKSVLLDSNQPQRDFIEFQFSDAVYPSKSQLKEILDISKGFEDLKQKLTLPLAELFEILGPGIYIVPSCRTVQVNAGDEEQDLFEYIQAEIDPDLASRLSLRYNVNRLRYRKQKLNFLKTLANHPKFQEDPWKEKLARVRNRLNTIVSRIENTRSKSTLRQRGKNQQRKTRRPTRK